MKTALKSKTVWLAILQAVLGVLAVMYTEMGEVGMAMVLKSMVDISLRYNTSEPIR